MSAALILVVTLILIGIKIVVKEKWFYAVIICVEILLMCLVTYLTTHDFEAVKSSVKENVEISLSDIDSGSYLTWKGKFSINSDLNDEIVEKVLSKAAKYKNENTNEFDKVIVLTKIKEGVGIFDFITTFEYESLFDTNIKIDKTTQKAEFKGVKMTEEISSASHAYKVGDLKFKTGNADLEEYAEKGKIDITIIYNDMDMIGDVITKYKVVEAKAVE